MGQISSPLAMRLSKSMQWPSLWNDKLNFTKKVNVDLFLNMILPLLFTETIYLSKYMNNHQTSFYLNTSFSSVNFNFKSFYENKFFRKKLYFYNLETLTPFFLSFFGKLWLLRFNKWVVLVFYVYSPKKLSVLKKKKTVISLQDYLAWQSRSNEILKTKLLKTSLTLFF